MGSLHAIALDATSTELPDHGKRCAPHRTSKECSLPRYLLIERPKMGHTKKKTGRTSARPGEPGFRTRHRDSCTGQQFMTLHQEKCLFKKKAPFPGWAEGPGIFFFLVTCVCVFGISMCFIMFCSSLLV